MNSSAKELWLAFEGGGSHTRILLADDSGAVLAREQAGPASVLYVHPTQYARTVTPLLRRLARRAKAAGLPVAAAGLAGPMNASLVQEAIRSVFGEIPCVLCGEGDVALAFYRLACGVSLVAGTGASCRCIDEKGRMNACGGFGPQFDDAGSGYWIGREGIAAAVRAADGRAPKTALQEQVCDHFGLAQLRDLLVFVDKSGHVSGTLVASFAPRVCEAAYTGDPAARSIMQTAGRALGELLVATARGSRIRKRPIPAVLTGGVFHAAELVLPPMKRVLRSSGIPFELLPPVLEPTMGLIRILAKERKHARVS